MSLCSNCVGDASISAKINAALADLERIKELLISFSKPVIVPTTNVDAPVSPALLGINKNNSIMTRSKVKAVPKASLGRAGVVAAGAGNAVKPFVPAGAARPVGGSLSTAKLMLPALSSAGVAVRSDVVLSPALHGSVDVVADAGTTVSPALGAHRIELSTGAAADVPVSSAAAAATSTAASSSMPLSFVAAAASAVSPAELAIANVSTPAPASDNAEQALVTANLQSTTPTLCAAAPVTCVAPVKSASLAVDASTSSAVQAPDWKIIAKRKRSRNNIKPLVIGSSSSNELSVVSEFKWLHISSFSPGVTAADILAYASKSAKIDQKLLVCYPLIKKDTDISKLRKINFKLGVVDCCYEKLLKADIWPTSVLIRPFRFFPRDGTLLTGS